MAIKTFTTGEVLTASDTHTYLANSGLVYVTSATVGTGVSSVTISNCFSTTYDNYRVVINGVGASASLGLLARMGAAATGYYGNFTYVLYSGTSYTFVPMNNATSWYIALSDSSSPSVATSFDVMQPFLSARTFYTGGYYGRGYTGNFGGALENSNSYTSLVLIPESGTLTGGTVTVYGYRKA